MTEPLKEFNVDSLYEKLLKKTTSLSCPVVLHPDLYDLGVKHGIINGEDDERYVKSEYVTEAGQ